MFLKCLNQNNRFIRGRDPGDRQKIDYFSLMKYFVFIDVNWTVCAGKIVLLVNISGFLLS